MYINIYIYIYIYIPKDKQLYIYNDKFEKIANHGSLKFSLKKKINFPL